MRRALTKEQTRSFLVDYEDGWTPKELSIMYKISLRTVYRYLAENDVKMVHRPRKRRVKSKHRPLELKPCGTPAAYRRHKRNNEYPCTPCLEAWAALTKFYKDRSKKRG